METIKIKRGITIEGQKALDNFYKQLEKDINYVIRNIVYTLAGCDDFGLNSEQRKDMTYHITYIKSRLYNNVVRNVLTPLVSNPLKSENKTSAENSIDDLNEFITYSTITDSYGAKVKVKESCNADAPHVWIFVEEGSLGQFNNGATHLNVEQASAIRDALTEFIDQIPSRWDLSEKDLSKTE